MENLEKMMAKVLVVFGVGIFVWAGLEWYSNPLCHNPGFSLLLMLAGVPFCTGLIVGGPKVVAWLTGWTVSFMIAVSIFALIGTFIPIFKAVKTTIWLTITIFLGYILMSGTAAGLVVIFGDEFIVKIENRAERFGLFLQ